MAVFCDVCSKGYGIYDVTGYSVDGKRYVMCYNCYNKFVKSKADKEETIAKITKLNIDSSFKKRLLDEVQNSDKKNSKAYEPAEGAIPFNVTTGSAIEGYIIASTIGIKSECVIINTSSKSATGKISEDRTDMFIGKLKAAKEKAVRKLYHAVLKDGGNAVIGICFDCVRLSDTAICVSANGTGVIIE